jgi:hypothetical protein
MCCLKEHQRYLQTRDLARGVRNKMPSYKKKKTRPVRYPEAVAELRCELVDGAGMDKLYIT